MSVLVTGAAGFIGFHLCRKMAGQSTEVVGLDSINDYYDPELKIARLSQLGIDRTAAFSAGVAPSQAFPSFSFLKLDIEDRTGLERLFAEHGFEAVVHLAAQAGVRYSIENPHAYIGTNVAGFLNVLEACRAFPPRHLVFASSSSVYGLLQRIPFGEHDITDHPVSLYAATKKANEMMAHAYSHLYGIPTTGLRLFTVYGPWGRPDMAYYKFACSIMNGLPIELYNFGDMMRDFTYIDDAVDAVVRVVERLPTPDPSWSPHHPDPSGSSAPFRIYNVGNNRAESLSVLVSALEQCLGKKAKRHPVPMQPGDVRETEANVADIARDVDWKPSTPLDVGIKRFVDWFRTYHA